MYRPELAAQVARICSPLVEASMYRQITEPIALVVQIYWLLAQAVACYRTILPDLTGLTRLVAQRCSRPGRAGLVVQTGPPLVLAELVVQIRFPLGLAVQTNSLLELAGQVVQICSLAGLAGQAVQIRSLAGLAGQVVQICSLPGLAGRAGRIYSLAELAALAVRICSMPVQAVTCHQTIILLELWVWPQITVLIAPAFQIY